MSGLSRDREVSQRNSEEFTDQPLGRYSVRGKRTQTQYDSEERTGRTPQTGNPYLLVLILEMWVLIIFKS